MQRVARHARRAAQEASRVSCAACAGARRAPCAPRAVSAARPARRAQRVPRAVRHARGVAREASRAPRAPRAPLCAARSPKRAARRRARQAWLLARRRAPRRAARHATSSVAHGRARQDADVVARDARVPALVVGCRGVGLKKASHVVARGHGSPPRHHARSAVPGPAHGRCASNSFNVAWSPAQPGAAAGQRDYRARKFLVQSARLLYRPPEIQTRACMPPQRAVAVCC